MTKDQLETIRRELAAISPAPWRVDASEPDDVVVWAGPRGPGAELVANLGERIEPVGVVNGASLPNGTFIAHAPTHVAALLEEVDRLRDGLRAFLGKPWCEGGDNPEIRGWHVEYKDLAALHALLGKAESNGPR